jgi:head-tail adaptor
MGIASKLDRKVQFQRNVGTVDAFGGVTEEWRAGEIAASATTRFHVRSSAFTRDIDPRDRLTCEGETFEITGTKQVHPGRRQLIELTCARRTDV